MGKRTQVIATHAAKKTYTMKHTKGCTSCAMWETPQPDQAEAGGGRRGAGERPATAGQRTTATKGSGACKTAMTEKRKHKREKRLGDDDAVQEAHAAAGSNRRFGRPSSKRMAVVCPSTARRAACGSPSAAC